MDQRLREVRINAPISDLVGIGQRVARDATANAHVVELALLGPKTHLDIAQALPVGQLGEGHTEKLIKAGERLDLVVAIVAPDTPTESVHRQMVHYLRENEFACVHIPEPLVCESAEEARAKGPRHSSR